MPPTRQPSWHLSAAGPGIHSLAAIPVPPLLSLLHCIGIAPQFGKGTSDRTHATGRHRCRRLFDLSRHPARTTAAPILITFVSLGPFFSPGSAIASIVVSSQGGILDESSITLVTGLSFRPGTVATSGTNVLGNVFGSDLTITLGIPASEFSVQTIGSQASGSFGTITVAACDGGSPLGTASSGPDVIGDSSAPEDDLVSDEGKDSGSAGRLQLRGGQPCYELARSGGGGGESYGRTSSEKLMSAEES